MRKVFALAALAATCVAAVFVLAAAAAPAKESGRVIRFIEVDNERTDLFSDADHNNRPSFGDSFAGEPCALRVVRRRRAWQAHRAGQDHVLVPERGWRRSCRGTFFLPGGTIEGQSYIKLDNNLTVAVVGGTGAYAGARGTWPASESGRSHLRPCPTA